MPEWTDACLSLGSNLGRRRQTLKDGLTALNSETLRLVACSSCFETEPVGLEGSPFVNLACVVTTLLGPEKLHTVCLEIEAAHGRRRQGSMQSRTLDIDLLYYGDRIVSTEQLTLPHPRMAERNFVLIPLAEVAADRVDPVSGLSVETLRQRCTDPSWVRRLDGPLIAPEPL